LEDSFAKSSKRQEIEFNSKAQRAQGGLGLLSHTISVQSLQESIPKILSLERKEGGRTERAPGEGERPRAALIAREKRERERERGGREIFIPH